MRSFSGPNVMGLVTSGEEESRTQGCPEGQPHGDVQRREALLVP